MHIYMKTGAVNCKYDPIGEISPCSTYSPKGASYVHLNELYRKQLGLVNYDEFFDSMHEAWEWLHDVLPKACVQGYVYDFDTGRCLTLDELM